MPNEETTKIILEFPASSVSIELGTTITFDNISGSLDSDRVTVDGDTLTEKLSAMDSEIAEKADSDDVYDKTYIDNAFTGVNNSLNNKMDKANPTGTGSFAVGTQVVASGSYAQAEGIGAESSGVNSHAEGFYTIANRRSQHVFGEYNIKEYGDITSKGLYVEIVGNGQSWLRSNARTLDWSGNETLAGDLTYNGNKSITSEVQRLDGRIDALPEPMVFKGTLGAGGTIQTLPTASASNEGYTYKVITEGTYAGQAAKIGDTFTCSKPEGDLFFTWVLFSQGDTDTDTWRGIKVNGTEKIGSGISTGDVDFVDSDTIEWEYDSNGNKLKPKTKNIYTEAEVNELVEEAIYDILPSDTESGAIANFETDLALPLKSMEIEVKAQQEVGTPTPSDPKAISGWSETAVTVCKKNLFNYDESKVAQGTTTTSATRAYYDLGFSNCTLSFSGSYKSGSTHNNRRINIGKLVNGQISLISTFIATGVVTPYTVTFGLNERAVLVLSLESTDALKTELQILDLQIEVGTTSTDYEPYNGTTEVIELGGTYYGGRLLQDKDGHRRFEVTHKAFTFTGNENWQTGATFFYLPEGSLEATPIQQNTVCSNGLMINPMTNKQIRLYPSYGINSQYISMSSTVQELNGYLSSGTTFVYPLATPYTIDMPDGEPIPTAIGTNNIYADSGDMECSFKCGVAMYVDNHSGGGNRSVNLAKSVEEEVKEEVKDEPETRQER